MADDRRVTPAQLRTFWKDPGFIGGLGGVQAFRKGLLQEKGLRISLSKIRSALHSLPEYNAFRINTAPHITRRYTDLVGADDTWQGDLGQLPRFNKFQYFIVLVDIYSLFCYTRPLPSKSSAEVLKAFESILEENGGVAPREFESDQESRGEKRIW